MRARGEAACTAEPEASITVLKVLPSTAVPETGKSNPGENITANPDMRPRDTGRNGRCCCGWDRSNRDWCQKDA